MDTQNWAAWVQAFGSILAILGSAWIGWWLHQMQVRAERIRQLVAHLDEVCRTASLLRFAALKIGNMQRCMGSQDEFRSYFDEVGPHDYIPQMQRGLGYLSDKEAPTASLLMLLIAAKESFDNFHSLYKHAKHGDFYEGYLEDMRPRVLQYLTAVELAADEFDRYIAEEQARVGL